MCYIKNSRNVVPNLLFTRPRFNYPACTLYYVPVNILKIEEIIFILRPFAALLHLRKL